MNDLFGDTTTAWAAVLIVALPLVIIGSGELEERLRQRDSPLRPAVSLLRVWVVPFFTIWALTRALFDADEDNGFVVIIASALVVAVTAVALSALGAVVAGLRDRPRREGRRAIPRLLLALPRLVILLIAGWLLVAGVWDVDLSAALTALGVTSLVISFALQDTLSGIASGFLLLSDQPFQPGDWIRVGDLEGRVVDINWRSTRIHSRDGDLVVVPNSHLAGAVVTNYDEPARAHRLVVTLQVAYVNPPTLAKEMLLAAARATPGVLEDPPPNVAVVQIDDPLMGYEVHLWIDDYAIAPRVRSDFGSLVWYHSHRHDVPLPSPAQDLYIYDGVQAGLEGRVDRPEIRRRLRTSQLLAELDEDTLDRLAVSADAARFAAGELVTIEGRTGDLHVMTGGRAAVVVHRRGEPDEDHDVFELEPGDVFGIFDDPSPEDHETRVVAITDCEVVVVASEAAAALISRSPELSAAVDQISASRRRRVTRTMRRALSNADSDGAS